MCIYIYIYMYTQLGGLQIYLRILKCYKGVTNVGYVSVLRSIKQTNKNSSNNVVVVVVV